MTDYSYHLAGEFAKREVSSKEGVVVLVQLC